MSDRYITTDELTASGYPDTRKMVIEIIAARALLLDIKQWAAQRCPCNDDAPNICPLCDADVAKDRCMAVDVSFPKAIRARLSAALPPAPPQPPSERFDPGAGSTGERDE